MGCSSKKSYLDQRVEDIVNAPTETSDVISDLRLCPSPNKPDFQKYKIKITGKTHFGDEKTAKNIFGIIFMQSVYIEELENTINCYNGILKNKKVE